jgi:hypothetical protein
VSKREQSGRADLEIRVLEEHTETYKPDPNNPPAVDELNAAAHKARKRVLSAPQTVLHLVLVANDRSQSSSTPSNPPSTSPSTASSSPLPSIKHLIRPVLALATEKGWPVCLEATSPRSRDIYAHLGFQILEEMVLGKGTVDAEGRGKEGGDGVKVWAMVAGVKK